LKKAVSSSVRIFFTITIGVFITSTTLLANDIDDNYLFLQNQRGAAIQAFSGNRENSLAKDKTTNNENSIDPDQYYVGGGDEFVVSVIGLPSIHYAVAINQQGDIYIPELGLLKLGKITLTEAQNKIIAYVREKLKKKNEIYVQLNRVKTVTVTVNGAVENPGTYVLSGGNRILDAIRLANKDVMPSINESDFREVLCKNKDSIKTIDMFDYLLKNDIAGNPYLYPGDNLSLLRTTKRVYLNSSIKSGISGWVPIKGNETLAGFLSFQRFDFSVDTSTIFFQSIEENGNRSLKTIVWNDAGSVILHDKDIITIPEKKNYSPVFLVSVSGEVARPGTYSIIRDSTTVQDVLASAGGATSLADIDRAVIIRNRKIEQGTQKKNSETIEKTQETRAIRPEMMSGLEKMSIMSDYSIIGLKRFGTTIKLEENDRIFVPIKENFVYISGNIKRPGAYDYVAGKNKNYYINKAGGYTGKASKSNVFGMRYYEKACMQTDLNEILEGDIIVVPESQQGKALTTIILPVISMILTTIGTIVTIITISTANK
jgi:protein involved in polysaccharide export with SLBB domain